MPCLFSFHLKRNNPLVPKTQRKKDRKQNTKREITAGVRRKLGSSYQGNMHDALYNMIYKRQTDRHCTATSSRGQRSLYIILCSHSRLFLFFLYIIKYNTAAAPQKGEISYIKSLKSSATKYRLIHLLRVILRGGGFTSAGLIFIYFHFVFKSVLSSASQAFAFSNARTYVDNTCVRACLRAWEFPWK